MVDAMSRPNVVRLEVIHALYSLSPKAYDHAARMIMAIARSDAARRKRRQTARDNRRFMKSKAGAR